MDLSGLKQSLNRMNSAQQLRHDSEANDYSGEKILNLSVEKVIPDPDQPRKEFDEASIQELADDIKRHGLIQPIVVRKNDLGQYVVITGERRLRAFQKLKAPQIKAIVREYSTDQLGYVQIAENIKRSDLKFYEMAEFIVQKLDTGIKQVTLADELGLPKKTVIQYAVWKDAPEFLKDAKDKFNSIRAFYDLVNLAQDNTAEVAEFIRNSDERITRDAVTAFKKRLNDEETGRQSPDDKIEEELQEQQPAEGTDDTLDNGIDENQVEGTDDPFEGLEGSEAGTELPDDSIEIDETGERKKSDFDSTDNAEEDEAAAEEEASETAEGQETLESGAEAETAADDTDSDADNDGDYVQAETETVAGDADNETDNDGDSVQEEDFEPQGGQLEDQADAMLESTDKEEKLKHPFIIGSVNGREAYLLFKKRPTTDGMIWVKYEDGFEEEILAEDYRINRITEE